MFKADLTMQFWEKIEAAASPLVTDLHEKLADIPTIELLNHYHLKHHLSQFSKDELPDGFWAKWRYLWALKLSTPFTEGSNSTDRHQEFVRIDQLVENIFDVYSLGAVYEPGRTPSSEKEFLSRLGLALKTREPETLCFPEQMKDWAASRLNPFNDSYFFPVYGLCFEEIYAWLDKLVAVLEVRLNSWINDMDAIISDLRPIQEGFVGGILSAEESRDRAAQLRIGQRLEKNAQDGDTLQIFSEAELQQGMPRKTFDSLIKLLGIKPGEVGSDFVFPHHLSPLDQKNIIILPSGCFYFLDPASAHWILPKAFEQSLLREGKLRDRYLANRSRAMENLVVRSARRAFPKGTIYCNYYLERGSFEKDVFILHERTVVLIECKTGRIRTFRGASDDLRKFESDFENSVQYGYDQANEVKRRILGNEEVTFLDAEGRHKFSVRRNDVDKIYIVCVSSVPRGPFGTDLSYELRKDAGDPFPLALGLFDLETICKYFDSEQFLEYLQARQALHGKVTTGDELNYAGYFLKFGHLNLGGTTWSVRSEMVPGTRSRG